jgi:phosphonate ABC transporter permease subunit PhnE
MPASNPRNALRRLLMILLAGVVLIIFAYGWTVTDIDLNVPQETQRQTNVGNALRELLSPNVFEQAYDLQAATTGFVIGCPEGFTPPAPTSTDGPYIVVEPACAGGNEPVTVSGYRFQPDSLAVVNWIATDGEPRRREVLTTGEEIFETDATGSFAVQVEVPRIRGSAGETHTVQAQARVPAGAPQISETTRLVLEKMVETIFLALIATAISILPAAILSFLAAQNLMKPVRTSLGTLLVSVVMLPLGWWLGTLLLAQIGQFTLAFGRGGAGAAAAGLIILAAVGSTQMRGSPLRPDPAALNETEALRSVFNALLVALVGIAALGLLGGLGLLFRDVTRAAGAGMVSDILRYLGNFIGSLGQLVELTLTPMAGIVGAVTLSGIGTRLTRTAMRHVSIPTSHLLGAVLGALAGAFLLMVIARIGMSAAWLGLLAPFIAGSLASSVLPQLYHFVMPRPVTPQTTDRLITTLLGWLGAAIGFAATFVLMGVQRAVAEGALPHPQVVFDALGVQITSYEQTALLIGALLGALSGGLAGTRANFPSGSVFYNFTRTILNALRSIEPLIMGLVFVIWVGIGPFAGVLALALHSIASLGKLYSEQIESIDAGPIEALESTGANRLQTIIYAVVPQIIPPYIAFTMYRWDINVRMSTIIGFVGGGGIGFLLQQQINLLRYRDAGVAVLAIAIVVSILDYASAAIRARYV